MRRSSHENYPSLPRAPNARRLFMNWGENIIQGGVMTLLHRVVFYGDHFEAVRDLGDLMGLKVIEEGGAV